MAVKGFSDECFNEAVQKALKGLEKSTIESVTPYQSKTLYSILNCEDTFVSLPTGHGKSLIYHLAPSLSKQLGTQGPIVLVISLLNELIDDQIATLSKLGIAACKLMPFRSRNKLYFALLAYLRKCEIPET